MGEGGAALVLENAETAKARGATILGVIVLGCGEKGDGFHRTRSSPDGKPIIAAIRDALADAGLAPEDIDYINAHGTATPENDKMESMGCIGRVRRAHDERADLVEQVDDRPHAAGGGRGRGGDSPAHHRATAHSADHQLRSARPGDPARRGAELGARRDGRRMCCRIRSASAARTSASSSEREPR